MKITRRHLRRLIKEAIKEAGLPRNPRRGAYPGRYGDAHEKQRQEAYRAGDKILVMGRGSHGTYHVNVVKLLKNGVLVRDEAGYEFQVPHSDILEKSVQATEKIDSDQDGIYDFADSDLDNDGVVDSEL
jgi:hypothetical protein